MATRGKVGKTASNALRSYNRIINNITEQCDKYRELSSVLGSNMKMAVVYSNKDGYIKYIGAETFVNIIADKCEEELLDISAWEEAGVPNTIERIVLPNLPAPVSKLNAKDMQHIIPNVMRNLRGGGYVKWGKEDHKPAWWPEDVVFANVKQRPQQQKSDDRWVDCLRKIVRNLYGHYGYDAETYVDNSVVADHNAHDNAHGDHDDAQDDDHNAHNAHGDAHNAHDNAHNAHGDAHNAHDDVHNAHDDAHRPHGDAHNANGDANDNAHNAHGDAHDDHDDAHNDAHNAHDNAHNAHGDAHNAQDDVNNAHGDAHGDAHNAHDDAHNAHDAHGDAHNANGDDHNAHDDAHSPHGDAHNDHDDAHSDHDVNSGQYAVDRNEDDDDVNNGQSAGIPDDDDDEVGQYAADHISIDFNEAIAEASLAPRTSTPLQDNNTVLVTPKTHKTTPVLSPLCLSGKRNWKHTEDDPAVRDYINNSPVSLPLSKKRRIKPRNIFTPSTYM